MIREILVTIGEAVAWCGPHRILLCHQFYALSHLSWPLMIRDLDISFARDLQAQIQPTLKKRAGIARFADSGLLFRAKKNFGLGITPISDFY